jgi:hypothetical protein
MLSTSHHKTCREVAWEHALTSAMNVLYYQHKVDLWTRCDTIARVVAGLAASATVVTFLKTDSAIGTGIATGLGVLAALAGIAGAALRIPEKVSALGVLLVEYTGHQSTFEGLYQFGCDDEQVRIAVKAFGETEKPEAKDHPKPTQKLLEKSQADVLRRIGPAVA